MSDLDEAVCKVLPCGTSSTSPLRAMAGTAARVGGLRTLAWLNRNRRFAKDF